MRKSFWVGLLGSGLIAGGAASPSWAAAGHGKPGLWEVTVEMEMNDVPEMPNMAEMPPEVRERMKAMNIQTMGGDTIITRQCVAPEELAGEATPAMPANQDCKMTSRSLMGDTFTGEMTCTGNFKGAGHIQITYDSDTHYTGEMSMTGTADGEPMSMQQTLEGKWLGTECGAAAN